MEANTPEFFAELYAKGSYDELIEKGELFLEKSDSADVRQYLVLAYQTKGDFLKALKHSQLIAEQSTDEIDWFSYAVNAIKTKQIDLGLEAFEKALRLNKEHAPQKEKADVWRSEAWMCYRIVGALFVEGAYEKAFQWLTVLKNVYAQYKITDTTFLIIR
ncbi:hypothetical protein KBC03_02185 [Patescibacteria group bacterium]|nr:hypothetical protein [Patescibacteria group bacterium]